MRPGQLFGFRIIKMAANQASFCFSAQGCDDLAATISPATGRLSGRRHGGGLKAVR